MVEYCSGVHGSANYTARRGKPFVVGKTNEIKKHKLGSLGKLFTPRRKRTYVSVGLLLNYSR